MPMPFVNYANIRNCKFIHIYFIDIYRCCYILLIVPIIPCLWFAGLCRIKKDGMNCAICTWQRVNLVKQHFVWKNCYCIIHTVICTINALLKFVTQWFDQYQSSRAILWFWLYFSHKSLISYWFWFIPQGGLENIELAKTYYSQAVKLNPNNLRALYGLYLVCNHVILKSQSTQLFSI